MAPACQHNVIFTNQIEVILYYSINQPLYSERFSGTKNQVSLLCLIEVVVAIHVCVWVTVTSHHNIANQYHTSFMCVK